MAELERKIPKDKNDVDGSLTAVLEDVKLRNKNNRRLDRYSIKDDSVVLTYVYEE